ncbi:MAG: SRPBCC domain-containing protein [Pseudomonadota bacterium]
MKTYTTAISIAAPVERVWRTLTQGMPEAPKTFGILQIDGSLARNSRIKIRSEVDPKRTFALNVRAFDPPHRMVWQGGMPFGLFTGTRTFDVSSRDGSTWFDMTEVFSGPLSGLIVKSMPDLTPSFEKFASALKERAETHE